MFNLPDNIPWGLVLSPWNKIRKLRLIILNHGISEQTAIREARELLDHYIEMLRILDETLNRMPDKTKMTLATQHALTTHFNKMNQYGKDYTSKVGQINSHYSVSNFRNNHYHECCDHIKTNKNHFDDCCTYEYAQPSFDLSKIKNYHLIIKRTKENLEILREEYYNKHGIPGHGTRRTTSPVGEILFFVVVSLLIIVIIFIIFYFLSKKNSGIFSGCQPSKTSYESKAQEHLVSLESLVKELTKESIKYDTLSDNMREAGYIDFERGSAAEQLRSVRDYLGSIDKQRLKYSNEKRMLAQRFLPLLNIFANNERVDDLLKRSGGSVFSVGVIVPISNLNKYRYIQDQNPNNGPDPWSLGVLRGIDFAQKEIIKSKDNNDKIYLKALLFDDHNNIINFQASDDFLVSFLSKSYSDNYNIVGAIGHSQAAILENLRQCYNENQLPLFTTSLVSDSGSNDSYIHSLRPDLAQIASFFNEFLKDERTRRSRRPKTSFDLLVIYDGNDTSSSELASSICKLSQPELKKCKIIDMYNNNNYKDEIENEVKTAIKMQKDIEIFLSLNPNTKREDIYWLIKGLWNKLFDVEVTGFDKPDSARVFLGPHFADERLENEMRKQLEQYNSKWFNVVRIGPRDWRSEVYERGHWSSLSGDYGDRLNWYTYNAYHAMLVFYELLRHSDAQREIEAVSNSQNGSAERLNHVKEIRKIINKLINKNGVKLPAPGGKPQPLLEDRNDGSPLDIGGIGFDVCATVIFNSDKREADKREPKCYPPPWPPSRD